MSARGGHRHGSLARPPREKRPHHSTGSRFRPRRSGASAAGTRKNTPAGPERVEPGKTVEKLKLYGDLRLRYQYENTRKQNNANNNDRNRWRYRLRAGSDYAFNDRWKAGLRLETSPANDSTNTDWGGFFDKTGDVIFLGLAYLQYADDALDIRIGKHKHPFLIGNAFWDSDINPEGLSEQYRMGDWTLRAGQYIISEEDERTHEAHDQFLLAGQVEYKWNNLKIAPMVLASTGGQVKDPENAAFMGENSQFWFHDFLVVQVPVEYKFNAFGQKQKLYGAYGWNIEGDKLAQSANYMSWQGDKGSHDQFFNIGWQIGSAKKAGQWECGLEYRFIEAAAYSPNLSDSDFGKNELNQKGVVLKCKYAFTDFLSAALTGMISENIDARFQSDAAGNDRVDLLQVDLCTQF